MDVHSSLSALKDGAGAVPGDDAPDVGSLFAASAGEPAPSDPSGGHWGGLPRRRLRVLRAGGPERRVPERPVRRAGCCRDVSLPVSLRPGPARPTERWGLPSCVS